jgi:hypothetical protein
VAGAKRLGVGKAVIKTQRATVAKSTSRVSKASSASRPSVQRLLHAGSIRVVRPSNPGTPTTPPLPSRVSGN